MGQRIKNRPPTWTAWTTKEVRLVFLYWQTGRPVCEWAPRALPHRTIGTIRIYGHRWGLPPIAQVRRGERQFSLWPPQDASV